MSVTRPTRPRGLVAWQLLAAALVATIALAVALMVTADTKQRLAGTNSVRPDAFVAVLTPGRPICQTNVLVPKGSAGARVKVGTYGRPGPPLSVTVVRRSPPLVRRGFARGYPDGSRPMMGFAPVGQTTVADRVCFRVAAGRVALAGEPDPNSDNRSVLLVQGRPAPADISLRLTRQKDQSLLALAPTIFHRATLFRPGWVGSWTYWLLALAAIGLVAASVLVLVGYGAGRPVSLRFGLLAVGMLAFANATIWSLAMPPFEPPDEVAHYSYVESMVEHGRLPSTTLEGGEGSYARGTALAVDGTAVRVVLDPDAKPAWTGLEEQGLERQLAALGPAFDDAGDGYTTAAGYSPIYYGLEALPYAAARDSSIFTRLWLMRLVSALMAAATAALAFLFVRELVPGVPWAAPVAGLAVAVEPMVAFLGGAVNNDNLLFAVATLELYLLARILRRGLDRRLALATGAVLAFGIAVKPNMYALVPVAIGVVAWAATRAPGTTRSRLGLASLVAVSFLAVLGLRYGLFSRDEAVSGTLNADGAGTPTLSGLASYTWQWYLPRLPFMQNLFVGTPPAYDVYFKGFWANFGHLDTHFPRGVYTFLAVFSAGIVTALAFAAYRARDHWRSLLAPVLLCLGAVVGFALLVNLRSYLALVQSGVPFAQGRYLLPAIAVFGAAIAAAALAFGRRWGLVAATAMVSALAWLNAFSLGLVMVRFYT